ncbi:MAG: hypothetical protein H7Z14_06555 [Anaerolineae bacterium]|nr:hypothetical protein [Phycisphaerae bacterium]
MRNLGQKLGRQFFGKQLPFIMILIALACIGSVALAQQPPDKADPNDPNQPDPQQQQGQPMPGGPIVITTMGGGGGAFQGRMRFGGPPMMIGGQLEQFVGMLAQINLKTDFTLTADQKSRIQAIRDDSRKQSDEWRAQHADEIKQIDEQQQEMMNGLHNGIVPDPGQMQEIEEQRRVLYENAPDGGDHVEQIKALFTPEQAKVFETHKALIDKERDAMMRQFGGGRMIMGGPGMPPPPPPPADPNQPEPEKKK